jgi:hypothetical protein
LSSARYSTDIFDATEAPRCIFGHDIQHSALIGESKAHPATKFVVASCRKDRAARRTSWNCCERLADVEKFQEGFWEGGESGGVTGRRVGGELLEWGQRGFGLRWPFAGRHRQRERD